ncbi:MAG: heparinase II/III family protein [Planctomycetes bacterium]|nr:heparinase II/III family protein [Planctomycetota bacterium]
MRNSKRLTLTVAAATILIAACAVVRAEGESKMKIEILSQEKMLSMLVREHPRILARADDFKRAAKLVAEDELAGKWYGKLRDEADKLLGAEPSKYEIPDGLRLLSTSRRVLDRVKTLALVYRVETLAGGERAAAARKYAARAWTEMGAAAAFKDWNPRHFLDTAEMANALGTGYDWLHDVLSDEQRAVLRRAIIEKGLEPGLACYAGTGASNWWPKCSHNWSQVCNGGLAIGALAIADEEPQIAGRILAAALPSVQLPMAEFAPDGAWGEGPGYWHYAVRYNVYMLAALETALGTDFGLAEFEGFDKTGEFPVYMATPIGRTFNFADMGDGRGVIKAEQLFWLARRFKRPEYAVYEMEHAQPEPLDVLWFQRGDKGAAAAGLPMDKHFRNVDVAVMRGSWDDPQATYVGFKAGSNAVNHSHLDLGSFVLDAAGKRWAVDLGKDDYNLPRYFSNDTRWTYYRLRAESHNTLVINPDGQPDQDVKAAAPITKFESAPERVAATTDLTAAYARHAKRVQRTIELLDRRDVKVTDEVALKSAGDVWWLMHTPAEAKLSDDGRVARLTQDGVELAVTISSPDGARFEVLPAAPLPGTPNPEGQAENKGVRKLAIHLAGIEKATIIVTLKPSR